MGSKQIKLKVATFFALAVCASACTVYKSSDRDFFNSNGAAGAPTPTPMPAFVSPAPAHGPTAAPIVASANCETVAAGITETELEVSEPSQDSFHVVRADEIAHVYVTHRASQLSSQTAECHFIFRTRASDAELTSESRSLVERYLDGALEAH
jgi:hypothetical protein